MRIRRPASVVCFLAALVVLAGRIPPDRKHVVYETGSWDAETLGNHRVVLRVDRTADATAVRIPWRRRDLNPETKGVVVIDAASGERINNVRCVKIRRDFGELVFQPVSGPGLYFVHYLINVLSGRRNYPTVTYSSPEGGGDPEWLARNDLDRAAPIRIEDFPIAQVVSIQARDEFNSFYPMEVIATPEEMENLRASHTGADYLLFPEDRRLPIRMRGDLPLRWIEQGAMRVFRAQADRGEYLAFQIGVYACRKAISDLDVMFSPLTDEQGRLAAAADAFTCFNTGGVDWRGARFRKACPVPLGTVQPLWCGIPVPRDLSPGSYHAKVTVAPSGLASQPVELELTVTGNVRPDAGDGEPWRHSRLRWLNSTLALNDSIVPPYSPVRMESGRIHILGRSLKIGDFGLPDSIHSRFTPEMTSIGEKAREILAAPLRLSIEDREGKVLPWSRREVKPVRLTEGACRWEFSASSGPVDLYGRACMEFDGFVEFEVRLTAVQDVALRDIRLDIPMRKDAARFMMGMGVKGGFRPEKFSWTWDRRHNQDSVWLGDVNAGLQCGFRDDRYSRPLNTNFYLLKPLVMPQSWFNEGRGGCRIQETDPGTVRIRASGGPRRMRSGESLRFDFTLLITPFRTLDPGRQWSTRYYHRFEPLDKIEAAGANTINVHHATDINPFINYPFLRPGAMKAYVDAAHERGMKVKIYYTVRELSNRAPELFALFSLGDEIFFPGSRGGFSWLQEHIDRDYIAAWFVPDLKDAAVINSGTSRWHNYYVEGLNWLTRNVGIDGLYIDDVAFDRTTMKRVRRILDQNRPGALIDLHSANQFREKDGFANSANLYLEHFPYLDRLWFGEYFDYNAPPEFWLVEVSGIPFGLMGEMLQDGGNPWRGMLYGMTSRLPWAGNPAPIWKLWDDFGIQKTGMIGFWVEDRPIRSGRADIPVTTYLGKDRALIALASWADEEAAVELSYDWKALGIDGGSALLTAPAVPDFQPAAEFRPGDRIPVPPGRGWLLILRPAKGSSFLRRH